VTTNYTYDNLSHLLSVLHQVSSSTIDGAAYTYDSAGNRTAKTNELSAVTSNYTYDPLYELTKVTQSTNTTESYSYDPVGNRLSSLGVSSYTNNSSNELTSSSAASYAYDANGNTTSKTISGSTTNYTWDYENRLTSVVLPGTGGSLAFKYDGLGHRVQKLFTQGSTTNTTNYLHDGSNALVDVDQNGNVLARYTATQNIDEPLAQLRSGTTSFYDQDGLGSVTSLSSSAGATANTYTYDSFGQTTASTGSVTNRFQYTGREFDAETDLYCYRARYYDPAAGRFLSEDPIAFSGGVDFYAYTQNNPVNFADSSGLLSVCCRQVKSTLYVLCHCFLVLNDNATTLGGYKYGSRLIPEPNNPDDNPVPKKSDCNTLSSKMCDDQKVRNAFKNLQSQTPQNGWLYGVEATSNTVPAVVLRNAGFNFNFPSCAVGSAFPDPTVRAGAKPSPPEWPTTSSPQ
jgi:RHS repeat-associated protein